MRKIIVVVIILCLSYYSYTRFDDFCEEIYKHYIFGSGTPQDKYLFERLNNIVEGNKLQRNNARNDILKLIRKRRVGKCYVKFLESLSTYKNDFLVTLNNQESAQKQSSKLKKYIGDKIDCLMIKSELNFTMNIKLPDIICNIHKCQTTLLQLQSAFVRNDVEQDTGSLILSSFLEVFWGNYNNSKKAVKAKIENTWKNDICRYINYSILKPMIKDTNETDANELIKNDKFKMRISDYIRNYYGRFLLPNCGKRCIEEVIKSADNIKLRCELRSQLLGIVVSSFLEMFVVHKKLEKQLVIRFFEMVEKLIIGKCYMVHMLIDLVFYLQLYKDFDIMKMLLNRMFPAIEGNSFDAQFLKYMFVSGFINVSDKIHEIKMIERLLEIFRREFENTTNYDYKDLLLRALFAFNDYKYILKNKNELFNEYIFRSRNLGIKNIPSAYADFFVNTALQIGGLYGIDIFRNFVIENASDVIVSLDKKGAKIQDIKYHSALFSLFSPNNERLTKKYLLKILEGDFSDILKKYAMKNLLYISSHHDLSFKYLNKLFKYKNLRCLTSIVSALINNKRIFKRHKKINNCEELKLDTKAIQELIKISFDDNWKNKIKYEHNALNIFYLNFSKANKFTTYDTCYGGHLPTDTPPTFVENIVYGLEYEKDSGSESCNKLTFISSIMYLILNNLTNPNFYKKLNKYTLNSIYKGSLRFILRKIARELNATVNFKALENKNYRYLLNFYTGFILPKNLQERKSLSSYKILLTRISERFLITFLFVKTKSGVNVIKVIPFETAANIWQAELQKLFEQ